MISAGVTEAKANFAKFVELARKGETVTVTVGQSKIPVAQLVPINPMKKKRLGAMYAPNFVIGDAFWEPLLVGWDGNGD